MIKIDAVEASKRHRLLYYHANEIVTDMISPECIVWDEDDGEQ